MIKSTAIMIKSTTMMIKSTIMAIKSTTMIILITVTIMISNPFRRGSDHLWERDNPWVLATIPLHLDLNEQGSLWWWPGYKVIIVDIIRIIFVHLQGPSSDVGHSVAALHRHRRPVHRWPRRFYYQVNWLQQKKTSQIVSIISCHHWLSNITMSSSTPSLG